MNISALEKSVLKTLVYFDIFSFPLTAEELFYFLWCPPALTKEDFFSGIKILVEQEKIFTQDGFYFLPGRQEIISNRLNKKVILEKKIKKARRAARLLSFVPFLKAVFLCNSVAAGTANKDSDIDFLIITSPGRIWLVRALANFLLRIVGWRTYGKKLANRVCLSFFVDENNLDFSNLRASEEDIHFAYWVHQTIPLFNLNNLWSNFIKFNQWTVRYLPYIRNWEKDEETIVWGRGAQIWRKIWETFWRGWYGDLIEKQTEGLGKQKMKINIKEKAKTDDKSVVLTSGIIKLHEHDSRIVVREKWLEKIKGI